ncbi:hypothetical protein [Flavonifractor plautii]|uniref:DUF4830 domain-containing protein n=1 Tax=Flavonifractor plautii TaxID=292800 RepID=A0AAX1KNC8_FLAPL|nr:hypothetical protein [Flavonifractor plautii]QQR07491.1 hypothetical protein I5Q84_08465 [Flavonifractor plautii]UQA28344.1 hypothetical protein M2853_08875 [Flavonifractor plautii]
MHKRNKAELVILSLGAMMLVTVGASNANLTPYDVSEGTSVNQTVSASQHFASNENSINQAIEKALQCEEDIQYYAYLDLATANDDLKPIILAARNRIIFRYSWVADGLSGRVYSHDGTLVKEQPQFSELFPEDWDPPVFH